MLRHGRCGCCPSASQRPLCARMQLSLLPVLCGLAGIAERWHARTTTAGLLLQLLLLS